MGGGQRLVVELVRVDEWSGALLLGGLERAKPSPRTR